MARHQAHHHQRYLTSTILRTDMLGHACVRIDTGQSVFATTTDRRITITRVLLDDDQGAAEWTWSETRRADGRRSSVEDAIIFVVRDEQIVSWREYFDTAAFVDRA